VTPILGIFDSAKSGNLYFSSYDSISTVTVGAGGAASIDITSIPSTYTHLQLRCFLQANRATYGMGEFELTVNNAGGTNYSRNGVVGYGSGGTGYWELQILLISTQIEVLEQILVELMLPW